MNFQGGQKPPLGGGLHVTCNAHLRTWPSNSRQKSCVKIWFRLVEAFKSYCVHKHTNVEKKVKPFGFEPPERGLQ